MADQAAPLLGVKMRPPWRSRGVIMRPRLDAFLDLIQNRPLTVVVAPPGFGKTTVALAWVDALRGAGGRVAWLSLGPEDDEPERFLDYVEAAMAPVCGKPDAPNTEALSATFSVPMETRVAWLLEEVGGIAQDVYFFLDDYHWLSNPQIHAALVFLLRYAPENLHLVLLSRERLSLNVDWLRARDSVFEISANALLFDVSETDQLLQKGEFIHAVADHAPALHTLTGGWVAALRAAVVAMRNHGRPEQYLHRLPASLRPISNLFSDLLEGLSPEVVHFLMCVCVTERQCAALAELLSGCGNGQAVLEQLERTQLFIDRQDERASWFVFHPLFREFLELRARAQEGWDACTLHGRAAHWFATQGLWAEAIHHALAANDVAQALAWIETRAMALVGEGDLLTLLSWERQLSTHLVASPTRLRLAFAWALCLAMDSDRALALLGSVELELAAQAPGQTHSRLQRECQALRAVLLAEKGDYEAASVLANQYLREPVAQRWVPNAILNVIASAHLHAGRWEQLYGVPPLAQDSHAPHVRDRTSQVYRLCILGLAEYRQGHLEDAVRYLQSGMDLGAAMGARGQVLQALPAPTLALVRYEQGRISEARRINAEHFEINRRVGPIDGLSGCYRVAARMAHMQGQAVLARTLLDDAESIAGARGWVRVKATVCLERIRYLLWDGRQTEAGACIERLKALAAAADHASLEYIEIYRHATLAQSWRELTDGLYADAARGLEVHWRSAHTHGHLLEEFSVGTALALAWLGLGRHTESVDFFLDLCRQAQAAGAVRSILDQPVATTGLVRLALAQAAHGGASPELLAFLESLQGVAAEAGRVSAVPELLSPREHRILTLVSQGLSNKEIASNLGVTAETVKSHLKKIYPKLGVQNRAQAAAHRPVQGNPS